MLYQNNSTDLQRVETQTEWGPHEWFENVSKIALQNSFKKKKIIIIILIFIGSLLMCSLMEQSIVSNNVIKTTQCFKLLWLISDRKIKIGIKANIKLVMMNKCFKIFLKNLPDKMLYRMKTSCSIHMTEQTPVCKFLPLRFLAYLQTEKKFYCQSALRWIQRVKINNIV